MHAIFKNNITNCANLGKFARINTIFIKKMTKQLNQNIFLESLFYLETLSDKEININEDIDLLFQEENIKHNETYEFVYLV